MTRKSNFSINAHEPPEKNVMPLSVIGADLLRYEIGPNL